MKDETPIKSEKFRVWLDKDSHIDTQGVADIACGSGGVLILYSTNVGAPYSDILRVFREWIYAEWIDQSRRCGNCTHWKTTDRVTGWCHKSSPCGENSGKHCPDWVIE